MCPLIARRTSRPARPPSAHPRLDAREPVPQRAPSSVCAVPVPDPAGVDITADSSLFVPG
ncbi:hypothetical protein YT1_1111 [Rhodococcus ruber]|nr:hypothetical protein YT1_1111 [Rhodococcus ruber]